MLINKLDNENRIQELKDAVGGMKDKHLKEFNGLEKLRRRVDALKNKYDSAV